MKESGRSGRGAVVRIEKVIASGEAVAAEASVPTEAVVRVEGWTAFCRRCGVALEGLAMRFGLSREDAGDVAREVLDLAAAETEPVAGSFRRRLFEAARGRIADRLAGVRGAALERAGSEGLLASWERDWRESLAALAMDRLATHASARDFQVYELAERGGRSVLRIARELEVSPMTVLAIRLRLGWRLRHEMSELEARWN